MPSNKELFHEALSPPDHAQVFVLRLHQIQQYFNLTDDQLAENLQILDPEFEKFLAGQEVSINLPLQVIDQLKNRLRLDYNWFIHFDLLAVPDLSEELNDLLYARDVQCLRDHVERDSIRRKIHALTDDLFKVSPCKEGPLHVNAHASMQSSVPPRVPPPDLIIQL